MSVGAGRAPRSPRARCPDLAGHFLADARTARRLLTTTSSLSLPTTSPRCSSALKMAEYDLSKTIIPHCDRHLVFPLLAHLAESETFPVEQVQTAQYELAKETNMVDYAVSLFQQLYPDEEVPAGASSVHRIYSPAYIAQSLPQSVKARSPRTSVFSRKRRPCSMSSKTPRSPRHFARTRTRTCSSSASTTM